MHTTAERDVSVDVAIEPHVERVGKLDRVDVCSAVTHHDRATRRDLRSVGKLRVAGRDTRNSAGYGRLPAQELFDRIGNHRRMINELATVLWVLGKERVEAGERVAHGVEAGDQEKK